MVTPLLIIPVLLLPAFGAGAWEEEPVLEFVIAYNPLIRAHQAVTREYAPPKTGRWLLEHTTVFARSSTGASSTVSEDGSTTTTSPSTVGIQVTIPLASPREKRAFAEKALQEVTKIDEIRRQVIADLAQLRAHEADLEAAQERWRFFKQKSEWLQGRIDQGLEGGVDVLWENSQKLNGEAADIKRLTLLIAAQRQQVARYAGDEWRGLLAYLEGKKAPP